MLHEFSRNLGPRRKDLPDFEGALKVDHFDAFHRILVVSVRLVCILDHDGCHLGDVLHAHSSDLTDFAAVEGHYVATAPTNGSLAVSCQGLLVGVHLRCAVGCG